MLLKEALRVLSRSSKYAVSTLRTDHDEDDLQRLKNYLYVTPDIQKDFKQALDEALSNNHRKHIFCLCGSSGDGKSEILTQLYRSFAETIDFHLDATHSNSQHKSAVQCLDEKFDEYKAGNKHLAIGINIGMLQKFVKGGSERHSDIKASISEYFHNRHVKGYATEIADFFDFECYPRLTFSSQRVSSKFVQDFIKLLTQKSLNNPFYGLAIEEKELNPSSYVVSNFEVLSSSSFQQKLIELFGLARLVDEQFLIPRIFVDYIYQIIVNKNDDGIVGNVFSTFDNEFSQSFIQFDPIISRSKQVDDFYLEYATNTLSEDFTADIELLNTACKTKLSPEGLIRGAFLLNDGSLCSPLSSISTNSVLMEALNHYLNLIDLFERQTFTNEEEDLCFKIIEEVIVDSALLYANRESPTQLDGYVVSRKLDKYSICNKVSIEADIEQMLEHKLVSTDTLPMPLLINGDELIEFEIDLKTVLQAVCISRGFRPNRQNLETVAKFDELIAHIIEKTSTTTSIKIVSDKTIISISKSSRRYSVEA